MFPEFSTIQIKVLSRKLEEELAASTLPHTCQWVQVPAASLVLMWMGTFVSWVLSVGALYQVALELRRNLQALEGWMQM